MAGCVFDERRRLISAFRGGLWAAGAEGAGPFVSLGVGGCIGEAAASSSKGRVGLRHGLEERAGVGMERVVEQFALGGEFHDVSEVHDGYPVADVAHNGKVVGDEKVGQAEPVLEILEEVQHLGLYGDIEGGERFVADDEIRIESQGTRDAYALALASTEFVGIPSRVFRAQADDFHEVAQPFGALGSRSDPVDNESFGDGASDGLPRIE